MSKCEHCGHNLPDKEICPRCNKQIWKSCLLCHRKLAHGEIIDLNASDKPLGLVVEFRQPGFRVWTEFEHEDLGIPPGSLFGYDADEADRFWKALNQEE